MKRFLLIAGMVAAFGLGSAAAYAATSDKPPAPPGQGECEHGNSQKPCKDDPQPTHGKDCENHGNSGGVNGGACGAVVGAEAGGAEAVAPATLECCAADTRAVAASCRLCGACCTSGAAGASGAAGPLAATGAAVEAGPDEEDAGGVCPEGV